MREKRSVREKQSESILCPKKVICAIRVKEKCVIFYFFFTRENCVERGGVHIDLSSTRFWSRPRRETRCPNNDSNFNLQRQLEQLHSEHNMPKTCQRPTIFALRNV